MLLPAKAEVARHLRRYRAWERAMLASPDDRRVRATFEDSGYTLCVLMGKRCAREAADAAERYLRTTHGTYLREQTGRPHMGTGPRRGRPAASGRTSNRFTDRVPGRFPDKVSERVPDRVPDKVPDRTPGRRSPAGR